jgi:hypothetical protein
MKKILGGVSLTLGFAILSWIAYHLLSGQTSVTAALQNPIVLLLPLAMVFMGFRWLWGQGREES